MQNVIDRSMKKKTLFTLFCILLLLPLIYIVYKYVFPYNKALAASALSETEVQNGGPAPETDVVAYGINLGAAATEDPVSSMTVTKNIDITDQPNRLFVLATVERDTTSVTSVTFNGVDLTPLSGITGPQDSSSSPAERITTKVYYRLNPPVGNDQVLSITMSGKYAMFVAARFFNVDQANPFGDKVGKNLTSAVDPSVAIPSNSSQYILGVAATWTPDLTDATVVPSPGFSGYSAISYGGSSWPEGFLKQRIFVRPAETGAATSTTVSWNSSDISYYPYVSMVGIAINGASAAAPATGSIRNLNFAISNSMPWVQTYGLDLRVDEGFKNSQPASTTVDNNCGGGSYASGTITGSFDTPGIIFSGDLNADFNQGRASNKDWVAGSMSYPEVFRSTTPLKTSKQKLIDAANKAGIHIEERPDCGGGCNLNPYPRGFYHILGDMRIDQTTNFSNGNYVFVADGTITFAGSNKKVNVTNTPGNWATVIFSAGEDIIIESDYGTAAQCPAPVGQLQGIFSADNDIIVRGNNSNCASGADKMLNVEGSLIANAVRGNGSFQNNRDLCEDNSIPSITIKARADFILHTPGFMTKQNTISYEETQ